MLSGLVRLYAYLKMLPEFLYLLLHLIELVYDRLPLLGRHYDNLAGGLRLHRSREQR